MLNKTCFIFCLMMLSVNEAIAQTTFTVIDETKNSSHPYYLTGSNFGYTINGVQGRELFLVRGTTYTFNVNAAGHPFFITTNTGGGNYNGEITNGVTNSRVSNGTLTFTPNAGHPNLLWYQCGNHSHMGWKINISSPVITISGKVFYDNVSMDGISLGTVYLRNGTDTIAAATTNSTGNYTFNNVLAGNYNLVVSSTKAWGGVNATDALLIRRHFAFIAMLSGLRLTAGDVNLATGVNSTDALLVQRRFSFVISSFTAGDWVFENPPVTVSSASVVQDIKGICYGDVNGSYAPPAF